MDETTVDEAAASRARHAIVCLVMKGDEYVAGALVTGFSLRLAGTKAELVCMVTDDVSADAQESLGTIFDHVRVVPYIKAPVMALATAKQQARYGEWMEIAFTKWNCLTLVEYDKVLLLDTDKVIFSSIDDLFDLPAPAATFSSAWSFDHLGQGRGKGMPNPYAGLRHGDRVPREAIEAGLQSAFVAIGTSILLQPSLSDLLELKRLVGAKEGDASLSAESVPDMTKSARTEEKSSANLRKRLRDGPADADLRHFLSSKRPATVSFRSDAEFANDDHGRNGFSDDDDDEDDYRSRYHSLRG